MDLLAHYNDDSLHLEDSPSADTEKIQQNKNDETGTSITISPVNTHNDRLFVSLEKRPQDDKKADQSLEDEWLSFEKMISDQPNGQTENSDTSQYLVQGMVAYPGMSVAPKQISAAPEVDENKKSDDSSDDEETEEKQTKDDDSDENVDKTDGEKTKEDDDDDAFFKMRKRVKERDRSSSSDRSSDSSRSGSLSPPQLSPVHSENSQHSLPPPDLLDPSQDGHYKSPEHSPEGSPDHSRESSPDNSSRKEEKVESQESNEVQEHSDVQSESVSESVAGETDTKPAAKSSDRKSSRDDKSSRRPSHRSRSRSKHKESSRRHRSRSRSKGRRHRRSSKDRHRHRRHRSRDRKRSHSKEKKGSSSQDKKNVEKEKSSKRRSKSRERRSSKDKERKRSRSKSKDRKERRKSEKERRRSKSKEKERRHRDKSSDRKRRHSSRSKSRDRKRRHSRSRSRERLRSRSPVYGKKMTFKDKMRKELINAGKRADEKAAESSTGTTQFSPGELLKASALASLKSTNSSVTPQMALLQTMAVMHQKAQEITGVAVPKYYNPAAVNPLKYAEQVQKRKLLWSKKGDEKEKVKDEQLEGQWKSTQFAADQDGKMSSKFRKLMGIKEGSEQGGDETLSELSEEQKRKQDELFSRLDKEYEFARMATHTHRGVGLGFSSQVQFPSTQPPH